MRHKVLSYTILFLIVFPLFVIADDSKQSSSSFDAAVKALAAEAERIYQQEGGKRTKNEIVKELVAKASWEATNQGAIKEFNDKDYEKAKSRINMVIEASNLPDSVIKGIIVPEMATTYHILGDIARVTGKYDDAIKHYQEALKINPNFATAYANIGFAYLWKGSPDMSDRFLSKAIALDRTLEKELLSQIFKVGFILIGDNNVEDDEISEYITGFHKAYESAVNKDSKIKFAREFIAGAFYEAAFIIFRNLFASAETVPVELAEEAVKKMNVLMGAAKKIYPEGLPKRESVLYSVLAETYFKSIEDVDKTLLYAHKAIGIDPRLAQAYLIAGKAYIMKKDFKTGEKYLKVAIREDKTNDKWVTKEAYRIRQVIKSYSPSVPKKEKGQPQQQKDFQKAW